MSDMHVDGSLQKKKEKNNKSARTHPAYRQIWDTLLDDDDLFPMAKTAPKKRGVAAGGRKAAPKKTAGRKTTGEDETIDLDTPPRKKPRAAAARYSIEKRGCYTVNPYAHRSKNKIDVVLHEVGVPSKDAKPMVSPLYLEGRL
jgi:hypothetical protein